MKTRYTQIQKRAFHHTHIYTHTDTCAHTRKHTYKHTHILKNNLYYILSHTFL